MGSTVVHKFNPTQRPAYHAASLNNGTVTQSRTHPTLASEPIVAKLAPSSSPISLQSIERRILLIRGLKVMLDSDLADLYQVPTKRLNESVRRNISRFPDDFAFELSPDEVVSLRSQFATSNAGRGGSRYAPYVFTEHGVAMRSSVLRSVRLPASARASRSRRSKIVGQENRHASAKSPQCPRQTTKSAQGVAYRKLSLTSR